jgi:deazaflavin-dependent oxidoreductase (nitroreductase family)
METITVAETTRSRPSGALRFAFRLPIHLYRFNLGWLLGHRVLLLTHRGRRSGRIYRIPLEVIRYDAATEESIVVSAWGEKADWYRNIEANPAMEIRIGRKRYVPEQRFLAPEEVYAEIVAYERHHPLLVRTIPRWLGYRLDGTREASRNFADSVRMVAFRPEPPRHYADDSHEVEPEATRITHGQLRDHRREPPRMNRQVRRGHSFMATLA